MAGGLGEGGGGGGGNCTVLCYVILIVFECLAMKKVLHENEGKCHDGMCHFIRRKIHYKALFHT
jgi:hypothetical protein